MENLTGDRNQAERYPCNHRRYTDNRVVSTGMDHWLPYADSSLACRLEQRHEP